jgi:deoxyhypusine synthase
MRKTPYFVEKVKAIDVGGKKISELLREMGDTGFQGRKLAEAVDVWEEMINRGEDLTIIMGLTGSMSTTGMWKIVCWLIENRYIDILVSTGANISEDILDAMGAGYWKGSHLVDDEDLLRHKVDRFYDVFADEYEYRKMEEMIAEFMRTLDPNKLYTSREFLYKFGRWLDGRGIRCILSAAYRHGVPVYSPALVDSGYGVASMYADNGLMIDMMEDFRELSHALKDRKTGVIYIGGGVPKDFVQLVAVAREFLHGWKESQPHEYAIQITTDSPQWGGLSGCTLEEAVSWGKTSPRGKKITCYCDATIALPFISHALAERVGRPRKGPDLSEICGRELKVYLNRRG